jgi:cytochrome b6-f complex iron-sulfur subunit
MSEPATPSDAPANPEANKVTAAAPVPTPPKLPVAPAPAAAKPAVPPPVKPPLPAKPAPAAGAKGAPNRRGFLYTAFATWFGLAWVAFTAAMAGMTLGTLRFMFPNVLSEPPSRVKVGFPDAFEEGKVTDRFKDQNMWVVKYQGKIYALSTTCTHLGCTPNWLESAGKFKCPCHGSGFYITGVNFEGPAPRPLERYSIRLDGPTIVVDKSKKFQRELGQWENPESFLLA